jgi:hypothetical protein
MRVPTRGPRSSYAQARYDTGKQLERALAERAADRKTTIDQARGRKSTYPLWASRQRWKFMQWASGTIMAVGAFSMVMSPGVFALIGAGLGFVSMVMAHRLMKDREHRILAARPGTIENRIDRAQQDVDAFHKSVDGLKVRLVELEEDQENRPMPEAEWQKHAYGPDSTYFETASVIQRIDAELQRMQTERMRAEQQAERDRKRAIVEAWEKRAAEDRAKKWNALPFEIQAMGCETCQSMSHPANVCMAGDDEAEVTSFDRPEPIKVKRAPKFSSGGPVAGYVGSNDLPTQGKSYDDYVREGRFLRMGLEGKSPKW